MSRCSGGYCKLTAGRHSPSLSLSSRLHYPGGPPFVALPSSPCHSLVSPCGMLSSHNRWLSSATSLSYGAMRGSSSPLATSSSGDTSVIYAATTPTLRASTSAGSNPYSSLPYSVSWRGFSLPSMLPSSLM